ncbi:MAG: hypothetical protein EPN98_19475 [Phenylobacterium sp.]|uniref:hypothetical protein n=1 Tax=Phenylobacterium sp. TaxID=1871053 RepID=UPI0011FF4D60|nr:hypothetical protein [Phenylobacterium sp.]TAL29965.1 MAG: hypothetical protein EPN98_19475 [Phenylobacterium sp.]
MAATGLAGDLQWWREHRGSADPAAMREVLTRLQAWKAQHDQDRAGQPGPFLKMVWDGIFGDDDGAVCDAIAELEAALQRAA